MSRRNFLAMISICAMVPLANVQKLFATKPQESKGWRSEFKCYKGHSSRIFILHSKDEKPKIGQLVTQDTTECIYAVIGISYTWEKGSLIILDRPLKHDMPRDSLLIPGAMGTVNIWSPRVTENRDYLKSLPKIPVKYSYSKFTVRNDRDYLPAMQQVDKLIQSRVQEIYNSEGQAPAHLWLTK